MKSRLVLFAAWLFLSSQLYAEEYVYVTDSLQLRVYSQPNDKSEVITTIESGDSVEIIERQTAYSQIKTIEEVQGWVKSVFLVDEPPAKLLYYSVSEQNKELKQHIEALETNTQENTVAINNEADINKIAELEEALSKQQEINKKLQTQIASINSDRIVTADATFDPVQINTNPILDLETKKWLLIGVPLALLLLGIILGIKFSSWRMRKRLHGFQL